MIRGKLLQLQNEILIPHGLKLSRIEIDNAQTEIQQSIENFKCDIIYHNLIDAEGISIRKVISIKDTHNISDITYSSLRNDLELKLSSLYELKKEIKNFDEMLAIMQNTKGVYLNIKENKDSTILYIKFSADGAQIIKNKLILNLTFTVLNEGKIAETAKGNYTCGLFDITKEDYQTMCTCLEQIKDQINELNELVIDGIKDQIEKYIGCDLKIKCSISIITRQNGMLKIGLLT